MTWPKTAIGWVKGQNAMQKVLLIGYLGRDPEVKYIQQGTAIAQFSVATTERWKDKGGELQEHTEWFAVKTFGRRAEVVGEHLHKGSPYTWRVGSVRSLGTINKRVPSTTGISSTSTESSSWIPGAAGTVIRIPSPKRQR